MRRLASWPGVAPGNTITLKAAKPASISLPLLASSTVSLRACFSISSRSTIVISPPQSRRASDRSPAQAPFGSAFLLPRLAPGSSPGAFFASQFGQKRIQIGAHDDGAPSDLADWQFAAGNEFVEHALFDARRRACFVYAQRELVGQRAHRHGSRFRFGVFLFRLRVRDFFAPFHAQLLRAEDVEHALAARHGALDHTTVLTSRGSE